jgi:HEPN domain-containing protein
MVRDWRRAVEGLIELAFRNLKNAKELLATDSFDAAVKSASTGVENMARALIHCCGGKPEVCGGQEEPLRLLLTRFMEGERKEIGEAIQTVAWIELNKAVLRYVSKSNIAVQLLDRAKAEQIIEASERVLIMFRQVMARHFATELPGLSSDICPKCKSLLTVVSCFNKDTVRYECESCHNKWEESRNRA